MKKILLFILLLTGLFYAQISKGKIYHYLEFVEDDDLAAKLIERLYLSSSMLPQEMGSFYTYADVKENIIYWEQINPNPNQEQTLILKQLNAILSRVYRENINKEQTSFTPTIEMKIGFDYLFHQKYNITNEDSLFFNAFRDRDYITKFNERGNLFTLRIKSSYWKYIYFSSQFGLRENWIGLLEKDHHFAKNFHEIDNNFNQHAYGTFRYGPLLLNSGRSKSTIGVGKNGKLLLGKELPPLDIFRASVRFGKKFKFYNYMISLNNIYGNILNESELPKYMLAHRLSFDALPNLRIAISELMILNSYLKWNYLNPLLVYHNISNANQVNILSSFDIEYVPYKKIRSFISVAIDEIDFFLIEQEGATPRENRLAMGIQSGIKILNPMGLNNSAIQFEYLKTDRWLYNYDEKKDLTATFVEKIEFPDKHDFYRFTGHYLGSNAEAFFLDLNYKEFSFHLTNIKRGNNYILDRINTWDESLPNIMEKMTSIYLDYKKDFYNEKFIIKTKIGYTWANNFHYIINNKHQWPELWLNLNYNLFLWNDI